MITIIDRQPWQLLMFSALMLVMSLGGENYYNAKARFLLPAFALLLPIAVALARAGWARAVTVLAPLRRLRLLRRLRPDHLEPVALGAPLSC